MSESEGLSPWECDKFKLHATLVIFASRGSGKSWFIRDLLYKNRHRYPAVVVICPSEPVQHFYKKFIPDLFIYDELDESTIDQLRKFYTRQQKIKNKRPPWMNQDPNREEDITLLIIMDDFTESPPKILKHPLIKALYKKGRHFKIAVWACVQYFNDLDIGLRNNIDVLAMIGTFDLDLKKKFFKLIGGFSDLEFKDFDGILLEYTKDRGVLIKDNVRGKNTVQDTLFWYKAEETPEFMHPPEQVAFASCHHVPSEEGEQDWDEFKKNPTGYVNGSEIEAVRPSKKAKARSFRFCTKLGKDGKPIIS